MFCQESGYSNTLNLPIQHVACVDHKADGKNKKQITLVPTDLGKCGSDSYKSWWPPPQRELRNWTALHPVSALLLKCSFKGSHILFEVSILLLVHVQRANELFHISTDDAWWVELGCRWASNAKAPALIAVFMNSYVVRQIRPRLGRCGSRWAGSLFLTHFCQQSCKIKCKIIFLFCNIAFADIKDDFPGVPAEGAVLLSVNTRLV